MSGLTPCPKETPFFIVGNPRSGTTLLTFILSSHPRIHIPGETGFLPRLTKYAQIELSQEQFGEIIKTITRLNNVWKGLVEDEDEFYHALPSKSLECVLDALYIKRVKDFNAERWGDKTPSYVRFIPQIDRIFPTAQYIHVIRDGRDSTISALQKWGKSRWYMDCYYLLENWKENVIAGRQAGKQLGSHRYLEISYETLVQNPENTIKVICDFLGEKFESAMLDHTRLAQEVVTQSGHIEVKQNINTQSVERWQREMSIFEKKTANRLVGELLSDLSYSLPDLEPMTRVESGRFRLLAMKFWGIRHLRDLLYQSGIFFLNRKKSTGGNGRK